MSVADVSRREYGRGRWKVNVSRQYIRR